ncbi:hypothetical protein ARMSODRAFT_971773 [Armillaria solidipes]|uniref:Uncharacterized protein n=1 Tax=Armillaria solidipes TaxID=1076256 RepID=A0A2H3BR04_9AGAR|nr:hypothetical protein ARMSODRAFT_971773 [Armillaria solidipes]
MVTPPGDPRAESGPDGLHLEVVPIARNHRLPSSRIQSRVAIAQLVVLHAKHDSIRVLRCGATLLVSASGALHEESEASKWEDNGRATTQLYQHSEGCFSRSFSPGRPVYRSLPFPPPKRDANPPPPMTPPRRPKASSDDLHEFLSSMEMEKVRAQGFS